MTDLTQILDANQSWAEGKDSADPAFFPASAQGQAPKYFWIGCADSRVPANTVTGLDSGEIFVVRNISNLVADDLNAQASTEYAVKHLGVEHIIVCGHTSCGGVKASISAGLESEFIGDWVAPIQQVYAKYESQLSALSDDDQWQLLCQLNAVEQVRILSKLSVVVEAWANGQPLALHPLLFELHSGKLVELSGAISSPADAEAICDAAVAKIFG